MLYISCLGQFRVQIDDQPVEIPSRPAQSLLAYLALNGGKGHRRERLAGLLWPDSTDENARGYLRQGLWRIRKSFESAGVSWQDYLQIDEITVTFGKQDGISLDTDFLLQPKDGNRWTVEELVERVEVYAGELLPGFYDEWIILDRERLKSAYDHKMRLLLDQLEANQSWDDVLEWGERWIALGHVPEPAFRALMIAHAMQGDRSAVSVIYQRCEQALLEELGVPASKELRETYQQIVNGVIPQPKNTYLHTIHEITIEPPAPGVSPYKGLEFYEVEDAGLFFGRERLVAQIVERLSETGFLAVVGASGSGKSSIVRAGIVPSIRAARQAGNSPGAGKLKWQVGILTPTAHPLQAVSDLLGQSKELPAELALDANRLDKTLRERSANLGGGRYLLVVDQFEEIFTLCENEWEREVFLENLLVAGRSGQSASAAVILVIRADFYAQCGRYPALRQVLSSQQEYIGPMTAGELRDAIEKPAAHEGWLIEPGLVDLILREVGREPGALPLLSHTLLETWKRRSGRWMTLKGYAESGGVHGAIARTAELVFNRQLSSEQQAVARQIFLRLTELGEDMSGTRRRAEASEFISGQAPAQLVEEVLNILAASRLITRAEGITEIAHEALIREWPALRGWLAEDREGLRLHHQLSEAARNWESLDRDKDELYRGARLAQAVEWAEDHWGHLNPIESEFLAASKAEEQRIQHEKEQQQQRELEAARQLAAVEQQRAHEQLRSNRRLRFFAMGITLIFVVTLAAAWIAIEQRDRANRTIHLAHSRELAAAALNNLELDPQLSILLALEAVKESQVAGEPVSMEIENALHQAVRLSREKLVWRAHQEGIRSASFSPDGKLVATAGWDGTIKIWDAQNREWIRTLEGHQADVTRAVFHPEGNWLASTSRDYSTILWDLASGRQIWVYPDDDGFATDLAYSPDGSQLGLGTYDGRIILIDVLDGQRRQVYEANEGISSIDYSPDGALVAVVNADGVVQFFDLETGLEKASPKFNSSMGSSLAFSPDGSKLALASMDGWLVLWDLEKEQMLWAISGQTVSRFPPLSFSPNGRFILTAGFAKGAQVFNAANGELILTLSGHDSAVYSVGVSPNGKEIITGSEDGTVRIWNFSAAGEVEMIESLPGTDVPGGYRRAVYSPDGRWLAAGEGDEGAVGLWDAGSGRRSTTLYPDEPSGAVVSVAFQPGGSSFVSGATDGKITVWDLARGRVEKRWKAYEGSVLSLTFSKSGEQLISLGENGIIKSWDVLKGTHVGNPGMVEFPLYNFAISPDGNFILVPTYLGALSLKDSLTGEEVRVYRAQIGYWWEATFSADGKLIASAYDDGSVFLLDTDSGEVLHTLEHPQSTLVGLSFSPDDRLLATVTLDATLRLWDTTTGALKLVLEKITETRPDGVTFRPDGRVIAVSNQEGIALYFTNLEDLVQLAKDRSSRGFTIQECLTYAINNCSSEKAFPSPIQAEFNSSELKENEGWLACQLANFGGIKASVFNRIPHQGMLQAAQEFGWDTRTVEPLLNSDVREGMRGFLESGCDLIILSTWDEVTVAMPDDHLDQRYLFVTTTYESIEWKNVWSAVYAEDQASFLAGYLAAAMTRTGKLGIFGGGPIPSVLRFMDGFALGVDYHNQQNSASVELIGWTARGEPSQVIFTGFRDEDTGYKTTQELIARGADIIFPVAGDGNMAAASEAALAHEDVYVIGVDEDWAANNPQYAEITLTSVIKHLDKPVYWAMEAISNGTFTGGLHLGTLENGGVGLAPFYDFETLIPDEVKDELERIQVDIIKGKIKTR